MTSIIKTTFSIPITLLDQADKLAKQLSISRSHFFAIAVENFIKDYMRQALHEAEPAESARMEKRRKAIRQGDIYWIALEEPDGAGGGIAHPHVVIQNDVFNRSRIHTVIVCALTTNMRRAKSPGNVLLEAGEAGLPRQSVVEVSKVSVVYKKQFGEHIGSLGRERVEQIIAGMRFLQALAEHHETGDQADGTD